MSLDLEVFGPDRPDLGDGPSDQDVVVDGPLKVEEEDLPVVVARVLLTCRWIVQINMPSGLSKAALGRVERYARGLAESASGVVYDPQSDAVVWPRNLKRLREPAVSRDSEYEGAAVELEWLVNRRLRAADAGALLDILERRMPEAVPRRFGAYEPMQGRLERDGRAAFTAL